MAVVVSAPRTVVPRVMPNAKPDGRKIRIKPTYASGPKRPRRAGPKKNRNLYVKSVRVRDNVLSPPEPASPPGSLDDGHVGLLREPQEDVLEAPFLARMGLGPQRREVAGREVPNPSDISEEFRRGQVFGQRRCLGHVAQLRLVRDGIHEYVMALDAHDAVVRPQQPDEDLQRRRLAGAVRADEAEDFARVRLEGEALEGRLAVVRLPELLQLDRG